MRISAPMLLTAALAILSLSPAAAQAPSPADVLRGALDEKIAAEGPGCAAGYMNGPELVATHAAGLANIATRQAMTPDTPVYIASTSKQMTALALLILEQKGRLSLDDDVRRYIPELPDYGTPITLSMLLHHTSGLRDYLNLVYLLRGLDLAGVGHAQAVALITGQSSLNHPPGTRFSYTNSGYVLAAEIVTRVAGMPFRRFVQEQVFKPLDMNSTYFADEVPADAAQAMGYQAMDGGFIPDGNVSGVDGPSGIVSSIRDLALYEADFVSMRAVWTSGLKARALKPGSLTGGAPLSTPILGLGYAAGLFVGTARGQEWITHGGAYKTFASEYVRLPGLGASVLLLCNRPDLPLLSMAVGILDKAAPGRIAPRPVPAKTTSEPEPPKRRSVDGKLRRQVAGRYYAPDLRASYILSDKGGTLAIQIQEDVGGPPRDLMIGTLEAIGDDRLAIDDIVLQLERGEGGSVTGMTLQWDRIRNLHFSRTSP